jgi:fructose-1,6-bisphosphatase/inositol monophosphatase family enzyme
MDTLTRGVEAVMRAAAERAIAPRFQQLAAHEISEKAADDFVTVADREAEEILSAGLARLLPEASVVGEEAVHFEPTVMDRLGDPLCWIIDPLDGTHNFAHGKPPFGVLVALAEHGVATAGWILDVPSGRFCHALAGNGAFVNGETVRARPTGTEPPVAAISLIFASPEKRESLKTRIAPHYTVVDIPRCAAEQYPRLILGQNDVSIFERTYAWDHAAGVLFCNEAGGKAARPDGSPYRVDRHLEPGLLGAASPALWDELAERMASL